jgi:hypothetical protein
MFHNFFPEGCAMYETLWKNMVEPDRPQITTRRMRMAGWTHKATNKHSEYVIRFTFPPQQWLHERASMLRSCAHCLSC